MEAPRGPVTAVIPGHPAATAVAPGGCHAACRAQGVQIQPLQHPSWGVRRGEWVGCGEGVGGREGHCLRRAGGKRGGD